MVRSVFLLARTMAVLGGIVLAALILLTGASVTGRVLNGFLHGEFMQRLAPGFSDWALGLGIGPINGDFELVEAGMAFAIFAFLPLCQVTAGHATVDVFTAWLGPRANRTLRAAIEVVFAAALIVIAMQLYEGTLSKHRSGQLTFLLQTPVWWNYAASLVGAVIAALVAVFMAGVRIVEAVTGRTVVTGAAEAGH